MKWMHPRWYVAVAMVASLVVLAIAAVLLTLVFTTPNPNRAQEQIHTSLVWCLFIVTAGALVWICWVLPVLAARDIPQTTKLPPVRRRSSLMLFTLAPGVLVTSFGALFLAAQLQGPYVWDWDSNQWTAVITLSSGLALIVFGVVLGCHAIARLRRASEEARICYRCGYDLRGSLGPQCPECGDFTAPRQK